MSCIQTDCSQQGLQRFYENSESNYSAQQFILSMPQQEGWYVSLDGEYVTLQNDPSLALSMQVLWDDLGTTPVQYNAVKWPQMDSTNGVGLWFQDTTGGSDGLYVGTGDWLEWSHPGALSGNSAYLRCVPTTVCDQSSPPDVYYQDQFEIFVQVDDDDADPNSYYQVYYATDQVGTFYLQAAKEADVPVSAFTVFQFLPVGNASLPPTFVCSNNQCVLGYNTDEDGCVACTNKCEVPPPPPSAPPNPNQALSDAKVTWNAAGPYAPGQYYFAYQWVDTTSGLASSAMSPWTQVNTDWPWSSVSFSDLSCPAGNESSYQIKLYVSSGGSGTFWDAGTTDWTCS